MTRENHVNMDHLQVLALILEISGLSLAVIHVYKNDFSTIASNWIEKVLGNVGLSEIIIFSGSVDYDLEEYSQEERELVYNSTVTTFTLTLILTPFIFFWLDVEDGLVNTPFLIQPQRRIIKPH